MVTGVKRGKNKLKGWDWYTCFAVVCWVTQSWLALHSPMDCSPQAPLSMGFSRQEYWTGLPCPPPGDLPDAEIEPRTPALQVDSLHLSHKGSPGILGWVAYSFSRGSSWPRNRTRVSCIAGGFFTSWATREILTQTYYYIHNR